MAEIINDIVLDDFQNITSYDIQSFLIDYLDFVDVHYPNITNFFSGSTDVVPTESFNKLSYLLSEHKKIIDVIGLNNESLEKYAFWILVEYIEDIGRILETADNASKWLRSSITKNGYKQRVVSEYMTAQGQGLQDVERQVLKSSDFVNSWVDTALENGLTEENYTKNGGYLIKVIYKNNASLFLNSVVDNINTPEKTYGLDVDKSITFENDDLKVKSYQDSILQDASILANLKKGDDPTFPERGVNVKGILGSNVAGISYPIIFRDMAASFATDDSFKSFQIINISRNQDALFVEFSVETKAGEVFNEKVTI